MSIEKQPHINDIILKKSFEWAWRGSIKDFYAYYVISPEKLLYKGEREVAGLFLNKFKTRLREAFGNLNYLDTIKTKDFRIACSVDSRYIKPQFELSDIKYIGVDPRESQKLAWYLKYDGNYIPLVMCIGSRLGTLRDFLSQFEALPAIEILEETPVEEDWGDERIPRNDVY